MTDPFVEQLASLCREHVTRAKWVFVGPHAVGRTTGEHVALDGTNWLNLRFVTPQDRTISTSLTTGRGDTAVIHEETMTHPDWSRIQPEDRWTELPEVVWAPSQRRFDGCDAWGVDKTGGAVGRWCEQTEALRQEPDRTRRRESRGPVRPRLGQRFYDWHLELTLEESWAECERHAPKSAWVC